MKALASRGVVCGAVLDTAEGRWLMEEVPGRGEPLVVFTPATPQLLADRVRHAYTSLPTDRR